MFNHVPIFFRHELIKSTGKLYIIETHRNTSLYRGNGSPLPIGVIQLFATSLQDFEVERPDRLSGARMVAKPKKDCQRETSLNLLQIIMKSKRYYNFLIINATSQKAHHTKKKA
jgi:hypothetical protein